MQRLRLSEHVQIARLSFDRQRRLAASRIKRSALMRWRYAAPEVDDLLIIPRDLRGADPSFIGEIEAGHFGLSGAAARLNGQSPFAVPAPSAAWESDLHGFGWLRHLSAAESPRAADAAHRLVADWLERGGNQHVVGSQPEVAARRLIAWIAHAPLLLETAEDAGYNATLDSLGDQFVDLLASWPDAVDGFPRLLCLSALLYGTLCIAGFDHLRGTIEADLSAELQRQIDADGGHSSRSPDVVIDLLLDLLPLRQCYVARDRSPPAALETAIEAMQQMLRFMRLGCGDVARFNGMGVARAEALAVVLAYGAAAPRGKVLLPAGGMARLERGAVTVIMDVGMPPPIEVSTRAHAGCLAFEMSDGFMPVFVNCGAPGPTHGHMLAKARATASHSTLSLGGQSSSRLLRDGQLEGAYGAPPMRRPDVVSASATDIPRGPVTVDASHDGYLERFQLLHHRLVSLNASGSRVDGIDRLGPEGGQLRLPADVPFAVHFHAAPDVQVRPGDVAGTADLTLADGTRWRLAAIGAELSIEDSLHIARSGGPAPSLQIVLRGATFGETEIRWALMRLA
jgi:uncharacterized heparinase superfamily protein